MSIDMRSLLITEKEPCVQMKEWLTHEYSMTEKLTAKSGEAALSLLANEWAITDWWDTYVLKLKRQSVFRREILMSSATKPRWYARTIIPATCYELDREFFSRLEHETLNHLIFNEPKVKRTALVYYPVDKHCIERYWLPEALELTEDLLWLRFSEFSFMDKADFYLCELLFPEYLRSL